MLRLFFDAPLVLWGHSSFSMPLFLFDASLLLQHLSSLIPLYFFDCSLLHWCLSSSPTPLFFDVCAFILLWWLSSSLMPLLFFFNAFLLYWCLLFYKMPLLFVDASLLHQCHSSSLMTLFFFDASSMILLCPCLHLFSAHCVMPGRLKTMSVCALLREEKPAMHWQRGKKYLHYKELCLNLGQHLLTVYFSETFLKNDHSRVE
jgi:hypothetical protein